MIKKNKVNGTSTKNNKEIINKNLSWLNLCKTLSSLSETHDQKTQKKWVIYYMKKRNFPKSDIDSLEKIKEYYLSSLGSLCHLLDEGFLLPSPYDETYTKKLILSKINDDNNLNLYSSSLEKEKPFQERKIISTTTNQKQQSLIKAEALFSLLDHQIEKFISLKESISIPFELKNSGKEELVILKSWIELSFKKEIKLISSSLDDDIESYSNFTSEQKKLLCTFYKDILKIISKILSKETSSSSSEKKLNSNKTISSSKGIEKQRKQNTNKNVTSETFSKFKYLKSFEQFESFSLSSLLKAKDIFLFDTSYNKLIRLVSLNNQPFFIKGMSIQNIDFEKSYSKRISPNKIHSILFSLINCKKNEDIQKILENVRTSNQEAKGKCNSNILLLKIIST